MDLVTDLPTSTSGYDTLLVFVDRFTKMIRIAPCNKTVTAEGIARLFIDTVFKLHGMPASLVSDRDPRFTGRFWRALTSMLGIELKFSTAYHPQTDGQTERANRSIEEMLRHFVATQQDQWEEYLPLVEFAHNNSTSQTTTFTPFELNYNRPPSTPFDRTIPLDREVPAAATLAEQHQLRLESATAAMRGAQQRQKTAADRRRRHLEFQVGEYVWLSTANFKFTHLQSRKFTPRYFGPFMILKRISSVTYQLRLPDNYKVHDVFHVSLLKPCTSDGVADVLSSGDSPDARLLPADPDEQQWLVNGVCGVKFDRQKRTVKFLVNYFGANATDDRWEPIDSVMETAPESLQEFAEACTSAFFVTPFNKITVEAAAARLAEQHAETEECNRTLPDSELTDTTLTDRGRILRARSSPDRPITRAVR